MFNPHNLFNNHFQNIQFQFLFKLKDINEFNKRIVNSFFQSIAKLKTTYLNQTNQLDASSSLTLTNGPIPFFFIVCSTTSKQSIEPAVLSHFNFELELKVSKNYKNSIQFFHFILSPKKMMKNDSTRRISTPRIIF